VKLPEWLSSDVVAGAAQGHVWPLMWFKQGLLERHPIGQALELYRQLLDLGPECRLESKSLASQRDYARDEGLFFCETEPAGEAFVNRAPRVIGDGNHRDLHGVSRSMYVGCVADARLRGRSAVVEAGGRALLDYEGVERSRIDEQLEIDPAIFCSDAERAQIISPSDRLQKIEVDEAFTLLGPNTCAFGHWISESLPRYILAALSGHLPPVPVLIDAGMPAQHRQALELMLSTGTTIIEVPTLAIVHCKRLWYAPSPSYCPLCEKMNERFRDDYLAAPPARFGRAVREMSRRAQVAMNGSTPGADKVFLGREEFRQRKMINREAIEVLARDRGFQVVYPEQLDFAGQVRTARAARFVAGPEGSALFLLFFSEPGTRLCILNHPHTRLLTAVTALLEEIGIDVTVFTGPYVKERDDYPHFADYRIEEQPFADFLGRWMH
jgi:Glycosyltransferase 61